jgi:AcrR family transcriptional regulator
MAGEAAMMDGHPQDCDHQADDPARDDPSGSFSHPLVRRASSAPTIALSAWISLQFSHRGLPPTCGMYRREQFYDTLCLYRIQTVQKATRYTEQVPKLWTGTIEAHRREVHEAILETTAHLVATRGLRSVTMSEIAEQTGIGRATLYKYFPDVESILMAWHERQVAAHLRELAVVCGRSGDVGQRLEAVLKTYALMSHQHHGTELAALLHQGSHVARARQHLHSFIRGLLAEGAKNGAFRDDVPADELASYCLHALTAASSMPSKPAVQRLVKVIMGAFGARTKAAASKLRKR